MGFRKRNKIGKIIIAKGPFRKHCWGGVDFFGGGDGRHLDFAICRRECTQIFLQIFEGGPRFSQILIIKKKGNIYQLLMKRKKEIAKLVVVYCQGVGIGGVICFFTCKRGVEVFFPFENGIMKFFCSLKLINFLKDIIFYLKQLKFVVFTHSKGMKKLFFFMWSGGCQVFLHVFTGVEVCSLHPDTVANP